MADETPPEPREQPEGEPGGRTHAGQRRLFRSRTDHIICGVCGGLGSYFDIDPLIFRIGFIAFTLAGGSGVILYIVLWILLPLEGANADSTPIRSDQGQNARLLIGGGLVALGAVLLVERFVPELNRFTWPVVLIAIGAVVLMQGLRR